MNKLRNLVVALSLALPGNITAQQIADVFSISKDSVSCVDDSSVDSVKNKKIKFEGSTEVQSVLYDNFTFEKYSDNPGIHFLGSVIFPISKNTNISLSESVYYTPEMKNPTCENNVTDLVLSHSFGKFSVDGGLQFSQYLNQKGSDMLSVYSMLNYSPNDNLSVCIVPYKPLLLDWKKKFGFLYFEYCNI